MGSSGSKEEEGLPAKYARGCSSTEFSKEWRKNPKYKMLREQLANRSIVDINKSCVTIVEGKNYDVSDPSVMLLDRSRATTCRIPPRLQSIGVKQKSYIDQLIELRSKNINQPKEQKEEVKKDIEVIRKNEDEEMLLLGESLPPKAEKDTGLLTNNRLVPKDKKSEEHLFKIKCEEPTVKNDVFILRQDDDDTFSEHPPTRPSSPSWSNSQSEETSETSNYSGVDGLENIRSDVTVVPYDQAKARFESGNHKKRTQRNDAYLQLEELGLGFWNKDQWVPTKVVTLALSDQLSCAGADWPTNYRYRSSHNCQNFRSSFSEIQY